ncbi:MAG: LysR family transcriptional regulator [Spirochaetaceae bacterium]
MDLNFEWYKVFYYVAKEGQISKAAKKLFITQPAVSQSIKQLEKSLGGVLFIRKPKGVILTSEGRQLLSYIEKAFNYISDGELKFKQLKNLESGEIRIGASDTLCSHYLIDYLEKFHTEYSRVKIHVYNKTSYEIIDLLKSGEIDLGFINMPINLDKSLDIINVKNLQDCFICSDKFSELIAKKVTLEQLSKYPLLLLEQGSNMRKFVDRYFDNNGIIYTPELELGSIDLLTKFASVGFGVSFVTKDFVKEEIKNSDVFVIDIQEEIPKRSIGMVKVKDRPFSHAAKVFYDYFTN